MTFIGMMLPMKVQAADMPANPVDKPGYTLDYQLNGAYDSEEPCHPYKT